jgi:glutathione S-transferase
MVPVIVDDDGPGGVPVTLTQSGAIVVYLAEKVQALRARDEMMRTRVLEWMAFTTTDIVGASTGIFVNNGDPAGRSAANAAFYEERLMR